jgi:hypothetical protein
MNNTKELNVDKAVFILFLILGMFLLYPISPENLNTALHNSYNSTIFTNVIVGGDIIVIEPEIEKAVAFPKPVRITVSNPVMTNSVTNTNSYRTNSVKTNNVRTNTLNITNI